MSDHDIILWIVDKILEDGYSDGAIIELLCRKLWKAGYLELDGEYWARGAKKD